MYTRSRRFGGLMVGLLLGIAGIASGCMKRELKPLNPCLVSGVAETVEAQGIDKIDMLFAVDNSASMLDEQAKLAQEIPRLVETLVRGEQLDANGGVVRSFTPAKDLHLGVITTDLGVPGLGAHLPPQFNCTDHGDNGEMVQSSGGMDAACTNVSLTGTRFIEYKADGATQPGEIASRFGCLAAVGAGGCGYEMQLEAVLKALWPAPGTMFPPPSNGMVQFFAGDDANNPDPTLDPWRIGRGGDNPGAAPNGGFLRNNTAEGLSLVAIVLVTDEEDCSSATYNHLIPVTAGGQAPAGAPDGLADIPPNLRCNAFKDVEGYLYKPERYSKYLQELRAGFEQLVIFAAITGVPTDTQEWAQNYDLTDDASREEFYDFLLNRTEMQAVPDALGQKLNPACISGAGTMEESNAEPARRIVEVARGFGANGVVQSICQDSFLPAIDAIIDVIANQLSQVCLPRRLVRQSDGFVGCRVVWELPTNLATASVDAPQSCADRGFLEPPQTGLLRNPDNGAIRCEVTQLAISGNQEPAAGLEGWFYDDFTATTQEKCTGANKQRVAFTANAVPPNGVVVQLECLNETQNVQANSDVNYQAYKNKNEEVPAIGSPCDQDDARCAVILNDGNMSTEMFCHRDQNVCVLGCTSDVQCPPAWVCDQRSEQAMKAGGDLGPRAYCVNPTCGTTE